MIQGKNNIGKWKESLRRRAEVAFLNRDKNDDVVMDVLITSQNRRLGVETNEKTR